MHAYDFMDLKAYDPTIDNSKILIGHNRFGTVGGNSSRNAHPFVFDNVVGVHNGTIQYSDRKVLKDHDKFDTDSEAIYYNISELGPKEALKDLKGAWSLVWWDRVEHKLNFLRNKERPMYWTLSETGKELYWASESGMLQAVLARHSVKHGAVYGTPEDTMLSFTIPDDYNTVIASPERTEVKGALPFVFPVHQRGLGGYENWDEEGWRGGYHSRNKVRDTTALPGHGTGGQKSLSDLRSTGQGSSSQPPALVVGPSEKPAEEASSERPNLKKPERGAMSDLVETVQAKIREYGGGDSSVPFTPGRAPDTPGDKVVHLEDKMRGTAARFVPAFNDIYIGREDFDKMSKNGCAYCEKGVLFQDILQKRETIHWLKRDAFLCTECMDDPDILEYLAGMNIELPQRKKSN
jgi:hypothetical protein